MLLAVSLPRPIFIFTGVKISLVLGSTRSKIQPLPRSREDQFRDGVLEACGEEVDPKRDKVNHQASVYRSSTRPRRISGVACWKSRVLGCVLRAKATRSGGRGEEGRRTCLARKKEKRKEKKEKGTENRNETWRGEYGNRNKYEAFVLPMDKYRSFVGTINVSPTENRAPGNGSREEFFFPPFATIRTPLLSFGSSFVSRDNASRESLAPLPCEPRERTNWHKGAVIFCAY